MRILLRENINEESEEISSSPLKNNNPVPEFCRDKKHVKNLAKCLKKPYYLYSDLEINNSRLTSLKLVAELKRHGHTTTRVMPYSGKQRTVADCLEELISHYRHYHQ